MIMRATRAHLMVLSCMLYRIGKPKIKQQLLNNFG